MSTIVHFDIGDDDFDRAKNFYEELFNWKITAMPGISNYFEITTTELDGVVGVGGDVRDISGHYGRWEDGPLA